MWSFFKMVPEEDMFFWSLRIQDPYTAASDFVFSAVCFYFAIKLSRIYQKENILLRLSLYYFLFMGISGITGTLFGHGLNYLMGFWGKFSSWFWAMGGIFLLKMFVFQKLKHVISPIVLKGLRWSTFGLLLISIGMLIFIKDFLIVQYYGVFGMILICGGFEIWNYHKTKEKSSKIFLYGLVSVLFILILFITKVSYLPYFNYNVISHIFMCFTAYLFYFSMKIPIDNFRVTSQDNQS